MDLNLKGKVALVTAASSGLGLATAKELLAEGAKVVICSRSPQHLEDARASLYEQLGTTIPLCAYSVDLTKPEQIDKLVDQTIAQWGQLDVLITNTGGPPAGGFSELEPAAWTAAVNTVLLSVTHLIRAALPHLKRSQAPSVLAITSISSKQPVPGLLLSNVLRPGVAGLVKSLSQELGSDNIRVNAILPGWTRTDRTVEIFAKRAHVNNTDVATEMAQITQAIPLGRMAEPVEFAQVATFLCSPASSYISGVMLTVDGGLCQGLI